MHFSYYENKTCSEENVHSVKKEKKIIHHPTIQK